MSQSKRARYTLEYKAEAVRLVRNGQSIAMVARTLGIAAPVFPRRSCAAHHGAG